MGVKTHLLSSWDIPVGFFNLLKAYDVTNFQDISQVIADVKESHGRDQVKKQIQVPLVNAHPPKPLVTLVIERRFYCLAIRICKRGLLLFAISINQSKINANLTLGKKTAQIFRTTLYETNCDLRPSKVTFGARPMFWGKLTGFVSDSRLVWPRLCLTKKKSNHQTLAKWNKHSSILGCPWKLGTS